MPDPRRTAFRRSTTLAAIAAALAVPAAASAADLSLLMAGGPAGHAPSGITRDGGGNVWVVDHLKNVCKVVPTGPGQPGELVEGVGTLCALADPPPPWAPEAAGHIAYDPATESFYVTGQGIDPPLTPNAPPTKSSGVWRLHWNKNTGMIDEGTLQNPSGKIATLVDLTDIAEGMAFQPAANGDPAFLDFTTKRSLNIQRLLDPASCPIATPADPGECSDVPRLSVVGEAHAIGGLPLTHLGGAIYIAEELFGVTKIASPGTGVPVPKAVPVSAFPTHIASSITSDPARGRLYVGADIAGSHEVLAYTPSSGQVRTYQPDLGGVLALSADADGTLLIDDDPTASAGAVDGAGGSIYELSLTSLQTPSTTLTEAPGPFTNQTSITFGYRSRPGTTFECRFDVASVLAIGGWNYCGPGEESAQTYSELPDGVHSFEVRAVDDTEDADIAGLIIGAGRAARVAFVVDTAAPIAAFDAAESTATIPSGGTATVRFRSNEDPGATFECRVDQGDWTSCVSPLRRPGLRDGSHRFEIRAIDQAANVGPAAAFDVTVGRPASPLVLASVPVSAPYGPVTAKARIVGRSLIVRVPASAGARVARIIIERKGTRRANGLPSPPRDLVARTVVLTEGGETRVVWRPSAKRLGKFVNVRSIRVLVKVGPKPGDLGSARAAVLSSPSSIWALGR
jgi:hypothetical protein